MRHHARGPVLAAVTPLLLGWLAACSVEGPDMEGITVVTNGHVYTADADRPDAGAFAFDADGTILSVGTEQEVLDELGVGPEQVSAWIDLDGAWVLPGFQDSHVHVPEAGINRDLCLLSPEASLDDYVSEVTRCAESTDGEWVRAAGASLFGLRDSARLPVDALDAAVPDRPVMILDDLGHAAWTNTLGLRRAGISEDSADPQGGVLHRDPRTGRLTGLLLEDAQQPLRNAARLTDAEIDAGLDTALEALARNGVTTVSDAGGYWQQGLTDAWDRAAREGRLTVRAVNSLYVYPSMDLEQQLAELQSRFDDDPSDRLQVNTAKIYVDGIVDLGTARLLEPYDRPVDPAYPSGFDYFAPDQLRAYVARLHELGFRISFHAIGDGAVRAALDAVQAIPAEPAEVASRHHRLTHAYLVDEADLPRFAELGVVADVQVGPVSTALWYHDYLARFMGDRAYGLIPASELEASGALVTLSSDWDADPLSPLGVISRSLTRKSHRLPDVEAAVRAMTIDAAVALGQDDRTGSIVVGKQADFVVLDDDIFAIRPARIADVQVLGTYVGGTEVYRSRYFTTEPSQRSRR